MLIVRSRCCGVAAVEEGGEAHAADSGVVAPPPGAGSSARLATLEGELALLCSLCVS